ncbi:MAG: diaminobutyrate--2-oxoglutarate transaminase [Proteobacteria bacterium]|nr:diaminobutyrate--2-oxoglutarate transaminase [Pseudomonadota bacterium]
MMPVAGGGWPNEADVFARYESRVRSYSRQFPLVFARAVGSKLWDSSGRCYLDFLAGAGALSYGHNNAVLKQALIDYIAQDGVATSLDLYTVAKAKFLQTLQSTILAPRGLEYVVQFTGPTGTNAVEAALKIARRATRRTDIVFFKGGFHGVSLGSLAVTGNKVCREGAGVRLGNSLEAPYVGDLGPGGDTIAFLEELFSKRSAMGSLPAGVIVECIQGEGGLRAASVEWLRRLEAACRRWGVVLIVDDIQAGCGRAGTFFSFEAAGITPDVITLSKSLSGYGIPISLVLLQRSVDLWQPGQHNGTFRGNNHAFVTATAMINEYWRTPAFSNSVLDKAVYLRKRLQALLDRFAPHIAEITGRGMMLGVVCANADFAARVSARAFQLGLIVERSGLEDEVIKCMMPLVTPYSELDEGIDILHEAFAKESP